MADKVLVTGADGFIGSHLVEELVRGGADVRAFVFYNSFGSWGWLDSMDKEVRNNLEVIPGDIRDGYAVRKASEGCDLIYHLAALIAIPYSYRSPAAYVETNVTGTLNVLQAARDHGVAKVVHTSTSEVYGTAQFVPITEEHPLHGQSPYAASKIGADQMAQAFYCSFGTPVAIIRPFNTFGPRQSARAVLPTVILQVAGGSRTIEIGALSPTRNFNYIADTVRGFLSVAQSEYAIGEVINIGSDFEISIGEAVQVIAELMGVEVKIEVHENRLRPQRSEVTRLSADGSKAKQLTGWEPSYFGREGFKRALRETVDWFVQPENFRRYQNGQYHL